MRSSCIGRPDTRAGALSPFTPFEENSIVQDLARPRSKVIAYPLVVILLITIEGCRVPPAQVSPRAVPAGFAYRCGIHFCVDGRPFYFAGANVYDLFAYGSGSGDIETQFMDKARIDAHFTRLQKDKVSVVRLWMFNHKSWHGFEQRKGVYDEAEFSEFDYIIQSAKAHNVRLIPVFEDYWEYHGGIDSRLAWEGLGDGHAARRDSSST